MKDKSETHLFASANWAIGMAAFAALLAAQWHREPLPIAVLAIVAALAALKARLVILDFMGLRGRRPVIAQALVAWPALFLVLAIVKSALGL